MATRGRRPKKGPLNDGWCPAQTTEARGGMKMQPARSGAEIRTLVRRDLRCGTPTERDTGACREGPILRKF